MSPRPAPSLTGLRRVLAADKTFARVQAEAARSFSVRSEDYQISAPAGLRAVLLAEMADGLEHRPGTGIARPAWSWPSPPRGARRRT